MLEPVVEGFASAKTGGRVGDCQLNGCADSGRPRGSGSNPLPAAQPLADDCLQGQAVVSTKEKCSRAATTTTPTSQGQIRPRHRPSVARIGRQLVGADNGCKAERVQGFSGGQLLATTSFKMSPEVASSLGTPPGSEVAVLASMDSCQRAGQNTAHAGAGLVSFDSLQPGLAPRIGVRSLAAVELAKSVPAYSLGVAEHVKSSLPFEGRLIFPAAKVSKIQGSGKGRSNMQSPSKGGGFPSPTTTAVTTKHSNRAKHNDNSNGNNHNFDVGCPMFCLDFFKETPEARKGKGNRTSNTNVFSSNIISRTRRVPPPACSLSLSCNFISTFVRKSIHFFKITFGVLWTFKMPKPFWLFAPTDSREQRRP